LVVLLGILQSFVPASPSDTGAAPAAETVEHDEYLAHDKVNYLTFNLTSEVSTLPRVPSHKT
jgi:hypothetical protein